MTEPMPYTWSPDYPAWKQRQAEARAIRSHADLVEIYGPPKNVCKSE